MSIRLHPDRGDDHMAMVRLNAAHEEAAEFAAWRGSVMISAGKSHLLERTMRRELAFDSIEAIMPEVERLLGGHVTTGGWSLGAICDHLARSINLTLELPPTDALPTREQSVYRRRFFQSARFPEGRAIPLPAQVPEAGIDTIIAAGLLRDALERLSMHSGPFAAHPALGPMTRDEWLVFHARHAAHHLSFAVPVSTISQGVALG